MRRRIWLFRDPPPEDACTEDKFVGVLSVNYDVSSIRVLDTEWCNLDELHESLSQVHLYSGIIVTSKRAVSALQLSISASGLNVSELCSKCLWYAVGPSTKHALLQLSIAESSIHVSPAGNALSLASIIVNEHKQTPFVKPFLFICGDKRLDALPNALSEAKIPLQQLCVYQTQPVSHIALPTAKETATGIEDAPFAVVFFSPSGVSAVMSQHLQTLQCLIDQSKTRIIAIGPTTKSALVSYDLRGASIEMPESPQPDALLRLFATTS